jgi:ureidoglycolate hydrolase
MSRMLKITGLTVENFQGFGQIVDAGLKDPRIVEEDFTFWNCLGQIQLADPVDFAFLEVRKRSKTFSKIERHHKSPEAFYALRGDCLMLAAPPTPDQGYPDPDTVRAFYLPEGKGLIYDIGTWHWLPYPLGDKSHLLVIGRLGTSDEDCEIVDMQDIGVSFTLDLG